jgi:hypothetical protein
MIMAKMMMMIVIKQEVLGRIKHLLSSDTMRTAEKSDSGTLVPRINIENVIKLGFALE